MPSSTAARVACSASSTRAFFSFISISVAAPTLIDRHTAGELGHPLLQLFLVVVAGGFLDLGADALHPRLDRLRLARAVDDGGLFLADLDALGLAEVLQRRLFERQADFLGDDLPAGEDGDVLEHGLAAVAEPRRLHRAGLQDAAQIVDHQGRERFAFDFLGDDRAAAVPAFATCSSSGSRSRMLEIFLSYRST